MFKTNFPLTYMHVDRFRRGAPHEVFSQKGSLKGRRVCRLLFIKKALLSPLSLPALTLYSALLTVIKLAELSGKTFALVLPKEQNVQKFILTSKGFTDQLMLTGLMPIKIVAEITRLGLSMIFGSNIYFSPLEKHPPSIQVDYYSDAVKSQLQKFWSKGKNRKINAEIVEIEQIHRQILEELFDEEDRIRFLKQFRVVLRDVRKACTFRLDLDKLRQFFVEFCQKEGIQMELTTFLAKKDDADDDPQPSTELD
ncbi:hypothetical protein PHSC3_000928 [Chlamydiales bacterium STE3]|nr:hypothetical protein PHSC3_000928 [Chlamydiales bacterium STE3]